MAVETGDAKDLAGIDYEVDRPAIRPDLGVLDPEHRCLPLPLRRRLTALGLLAFAPRDQFEDARFGDLLLLKAPHVDSIAQHGCPVGDPDELRNAVGHDEDRGALRLELPHLAEQPLGRVEVERGRGLVEDQHLGIGEQRAGNGDPLLEAQRKVADSVVEIDVEAEQFAHQGRGTLLFLFAS